MLKTTFSSIPFFSLFRWVLIVFISNGVLRFVPEKNKAMVVRAGKFQAWQFCPRVPNNSNYFRLLFRSVKGKNPVPQTFVKQNRKRGIYKLIISLLEIGESTATNWRSLHKTKSFAFHSCLPSMHFFCLFYCSCLLRSVHGSIPCRRRGCENDKY